jgi:RNA polymerase sigma-70 factor, ECF subfamily
MMESARGGIEERLKTLFIAAQEGDADSYRIFLNDVSKHLRAFIRRRLSRLQDDVEDIVQETLLAVHTKRHLYCVDQPLTAWLHAVARYKLVDFLRARSRREALNEPLDDYMDLFESSDACAADAKRDIRKLLDTLPEKQSLPIAYMRLEGMSVSETAELTGLSESAVKVGVYRGLKALASRMRQHED